MVAATTAELRLRQEVKQENPGPMLRLPTPTLTLNSCSQDGQAAVEAALQFDAPLERAGTYEIIITYQEKREGVSCQPTAQTAHSTDGTVLALPRTSVCSLPAWLGLRTEASRGEENPDRDLFL